MRKMNIPENNEELLKKFEKCISFSSDLTPPDVINPGLNSYIECEKGEYKMINQHFAEINTLKKQFSKQLQKNLYYGIDFLREKYKYHISFLELSLSYYQSEIYRIQKNLYTIVLFQHFIEEQKNKITVDIKYFYQNFLTISKESNLFQRKYGLISRYIGGNWTVETPPINFNNKYLFFINPTTNTGSIYQRFLQKRDSIEYQDFSDIVDALVSISSQQNEEITCVTKSNNHSKSNRSKTQKKFLKGNNSLPNTRPSFSSNLSNSDQMSFSLPKESPLSNNSNNNLNNLNEINPKIIEIDEELQINKNGEKINLDNIESPENEREWIEDLLFDSMWVHHPYPMGFYPKFLLPDVQDLIPEIFSPSFIPKKWTMISFRELYNCDWPFKSIIDEFFELLILTNPFKIGQKFYEIIEKVTFVIQELIIDDKGENALSDLEIGFDDIFPILVILIFTSALPEIINVLAYAGSFDEFCTKPRSQYALTHMKGLCIHIISLDFNNLRTKAELLKKGKKVEI